MKYDRICNFIGLGQNLEQDTLPGPQPHPGCAAACRSAKTDSQLPSSGLNSNYNLRKTEFISNNESIFPICLHFWVLFYSPYSLCKTWEITVHTPFRLLLGLCENGVICFEICSGSVGSLVRICPQTGHMISNISVLLGLISRTRLTTVSLGILSHSFTILRDIRLTPSQHFYC